MEFSDDEVLVGKIFTDLINSHSCIEGRQINKYLDDLEMHLTNLPDTFENRKLDNFLMCMSQFSKDSTSQNSVYLWGLLPGWTWSAKNINLTKYDFSNFTIKNIENYDSITFIEDIFTEMMADYKENKPAAALKINQFITLFEEQFFSEVIIQVIDADEIISQLLNYLRDRNTRRIGDPESIMQFGMIQHILAPALQAYQASTQLYQLDHTTKITPDYLKQFWAKIPKLSQNDLTTDISIAGSNEAVTMLGALLAYQKTLTN